MSSFERYKYHVLLHGVVVILGFTGILGKLISLSAVPLVWHRMWIAGAGLGLYLAWKRLHIRLAPRSAFIIIATGVVVAGHWVSFFASIKHASVSVALVCLSTAPLFIAFLEPMAFRRRIYPYEVVFGLVVILSLAIVFSFELQYTGGILYGILSAALAAVFAVVNGRLIVQHDARVISFYELLGGVTALTVFIFASGVYAASDLRLSLLDGLYLLILGLVCTAFAHVACIEVMRELSPYTVSLTINLEPIYGIVLALIVFGDDEYMSWGFYVGAALILAILAGNAIFRRAAYPLSEVPPPKDEPSVSP